MATILTRAPYQVAPLAQHTATVIFMHGLGDTSKGWRPVAQMLNSKLPHVKWVLPNAPDRKITANMGLSMPGWFDLYSLSFDAKEDRDGMLESARTIDQLIQDEIDGGIPAGRIVVGGFSQGAAMSLLAGLTARGDAGLFGGKVGWKLGGVVVLSGWLPLRNEFPKMVSPHLSQTPVLMCHGTADPLVTFDLGKRTSEVLTNDLGLPALADLTQAKAGVGGLSFNGYANLEHASCPQELEDLSQFLERILPS